MALHAIDIAPDDDGFGPDPFRPALGLGHEGPADSGAANLRRDDKTENLDAKSGFDELRRMRMEPSDRRGERVDSDKQGVGGRRDDRSNADTHCIGIRRIAEIAGQPGDGVRIVFGRGSHAEWSASLGIRRHGANPSPDSPPFQLPILPAAQLVFFREIRSGLRLLAHVFINEPAAVIGLPKVRIQFDRLVEIVDRRG